MVSKYMHTINGKPGTFDGYQICYATFYGKPNILCESLDQIRKEQRLTKENRERDGFKICSDYRHLRYS